MDDAGTRAQRFRRIRGRLVQELEDTLKSAQLNAARLKRLEEELTVVDRALHVLGKRSTDVGAKRDNPHHEGEGNGSH